MHSLTEGLSQDWGWLLWLRTWQERKPAPGSLARSGARFTYRESDPLFGVLWEEVQRTKTACTCVSETIYWAVPSGTSPVPGHTVRIWIPANPQCQAKELAKQDKPPPLHPLNNKDSLNRVIWDNWSMEEYWDVTIFLLITSMGPQGRESWCTVDAGPAYTTPCPSAPGKCKYTETGLTLKNQTASPPYQNYCIAWFNSQRILII